MLASAGLSAANNGQIYGHQLQAKARQLRSALHHWQVWDAEYEALKEEVEAASDGSSQADKRLNLRHACLSWSPRLK